MARVTRAQLKKAITDKLAAVFPEIPIESNDVSEGYAQPSFFTDLELTNSNNFTRGTRREWTARIYFFPTDEKNYEDEVDDVLDKLEATFSLYLDVPGRTVVLGESFSQVVDRVAHYYFDFYFYDDATDLKPQPGSDKQIKNLMDSTSYKE